MSLRAPVPADLEAVHAVIAARDLADLGVEDFKLEDLRDEWRSPGFDLGADARLALDPSGAVVGWAETRTQGGFAVVAPAAEGHGVGTALLVWLEQRERDSGRPVHRQLIAGANAAGERLLVRAGYERVRSNYILYRELGRDPASAAVPGGVSLRELDVALDAAALHALDAAAFAGQPGYELESLQTFTEEHLHAHDLDPMLSVVAERDGQIVGFLVARRREPEHVGHVDLLAVEPAAQRQGVGSALLASAIASFVAAGLSGAELMVSSKNPEALRLYGRHGLTERHRFDIYEKPAAAT
jgi:mycothiol synthase